MHSSRMRTARSLLYGGVSLIETPFLDRDPLDRDPPRQRRLRYAGGNKLCEEDSLDSYPFP